MTQLPQNTEKNPLSTGIEIFDTTLANPDSRGFSGIASDGRYLYFAPLNNGTMGQVARYDTTLPFDDSKGWSFFDTAKVHPASRGFVDALFDGRYIYLIPFFQYVNQVRHHGQVTRYDTTLNFNDPESWSFFDTTILHPNSRGFVSGCFDGNHIYLSPYQLDFATTPMGIPPPSTFP
ncbi:MAG: hypothetical protein HQK61_07485 [Desulfamplus sp.]|nr:hypothetical protein [Desulfamplus sp.]